MVKLDFAKLRDINPDDFISVLYTENTINHLVEHKPSTRLRSASGWIKNPGVTTCRATAPNKLPTALFRA